ncbi:hypothetical protein KC717_05025, partial [Candidatus Dojkabacteria bacterium]|nr:hypothetical protein [Candidatus Dojkabacteria bacterium]
DTQDLTFIPDIEDSDVNDEVVLERYEFQGRVPFESADAPPGLSSVKTDERYEFVMPFDISPYMVAYLYHYSYSPTSEEYFVETNDILRNAGFNF